jgi:hypothetical protein
MPFISQLIGRSGTRSTASPLKPKTVLVIGLGVLMLVAGVCFASHKVPDKELTARRGTFSFIPRDIREAFVEYRDLAGPAAAGTFVLITVGWAAAEALARAWQKRRNEELAANAVLLRVAPRVDEGGKWQAAADLWRAIHSTLARPDWQTWLGAGTHLSLEMVQIAGERVAFYLWAPHPVTETIVRQLRATYAGLEVETLVKSGADGAPTGEIDDYLDKAGGENAQWLWADLGLTGEPWRSLRSDFAADPLPSLLSTLEGLSPGNELAAIHFILRPAADGWQGEGEAFVRKMRGDDLKPGQPRPKLGTAEREMLRRIERKAQTRGYDLCLRVTVTGQGGVGSNPSAELRANLDRLVRVFDQFAEDNALGVRKSGDGNDPSAGSGQALYRVKGRYFPAGWGRSVVSVEELAAMAHLPNRDVTGVSILRARARTEKPSPVSFLGPGEKRIVLGRFADVPSFGNGWNSVPYPLPGLRGLLNLPTDGAGANGAGAGTSETERPVGIPLIDARRHFHVIGPTGVGKSTLLLNMIYQYLANFPEAAVWLQEPHQDLTHKLVMRVPLWREKDVVWLDVMDPERVIGINPLDAPEGVDLDALAADVMGVIKKVMGASWDTAVQMQEILDNALQAVLAGQPEPTMLHVYRLLTDADYRYDLTARLSDAVAAPYWQSLELKKERELDAMLSVPRRRVNAFLRNRIVRRIIAQPRSTVDFRAAIDGGKVILVQLDSRMGGSNRTFVGAMMMYKLFGAVMSRMDIPEEQRRQVAICVDEFQTFVAQSGDEFADILEQARKMGASLTLSHQHLGQLTKGGGDLINSVANNTGTKVVFRAEAADAPTFLRWLPELDTIQDLTTLGNYRCYVRPLVGGSPQPVCTLYTYADPPIPDPEGELHDSPRGEPDPLPPHPGGEALEDLKRVRAMPSGEARKNHLVTLPEHGWASYLAARRYHDALRRNQLIERPELIPDKLARIRALVRLGYGTPHYETEALTEKVIG